MATTATAVTVAVVGFAAPAQAATLTFHYQNLATQRCLDDSTSSLSHEAYNDVLRAIPCNGLAYQDWREIWPWTGTKEYQNVATGRCLDDSTAFGNDVLRAYECLGNNYQAWIPY